MKESKYEMEIKTMLTEDQYRAMEAVRSVKGMTLAGYLRHLVLEDICNSDAQVSQFSEILERAKAGR